MPVSSHAVAKKLQMYVSLFGRVDEIFTDNGPQYTGQAFKEFVKDWGIKHVTSSPHYPKSNGFIERHVRHIKSIVKKSVEQKDNLQMALLQARATPIDSKLPSPAELMFGRPVATLLPSRADPGREEHRLYLEQRTADMREHHDRSCRRELPPLCPGQHVTVMDKDRGTWHPAVVVQKCTEPRSYVVQTPNGNQVRRCRSHLRELYHPQPQRTNELTRLVEPQGQDVNGEGHNDSPEPSTTPSCGSTQVPNSPALRRTKYGRAVNKPARYNDYV